MKNISMQEQKQILGGKKFLVVITDNNGRILKTHVFDNKAAADRYARGARVGGMQTIVKPV